MNILRYPPRTAWQELAERPVINTQDLERLVLPILQAVRERGDAALYDYAERFDKVSAAMLSTLVVRPEEFDAAKQSVPESLKAALQLAKENIERFHILQREVPSIVETRPGVRCWRKSVPIERVGLYIPGGTAPLFSTVLMLGVPAQIAGCPVRILCSPPNSEGNIHPAILYAAELVGIQHVCKVGGAQAIAAMAFGTASVPQVDKIFGPGNQYVTAAKQLVQRGVFGSVVAIDMPAGPSEVCVLADESCEPAFVAADLLSQAEHGVDSQVVLVTTSEQVVERVQHELNNQITALPRRAIAEQALCNSRIILLHSVDEAVAFVNLYAAEHLIISAHNAEHIAERITQAGSVFIGNFSPESAGDYASGTNHTLPTNGYARAHSGVSVDSFVKKITFQHLSREGLQQIGAAVEVMAEHEQLHAHKHAVAVRLQA
jgi:histidinol dehydrogenase